MSASEIAIRVENLGKKYHLGLTHAGTIRDTIHGLGRRLFGRNGKPSPVSSHSTPDTLRSSLTPDTCHLKPASEFWALRDVSFEVCRGEVLGIIGRNGAGKSTLLKILSQVTAPTHGNARIFGRVGALLEVGTGFHPELTGRENMYLNGAILGMTKREIDHKFDEIVDFAGVEKFIDTPVKRYSSGMKVRLGFAVAAHLEPEILVIDEVLSVGDTEFQKKCMGKMEDVAGGGRTILFVSHNMASIEYLCDRVVLLSDEGLEKEGDPADVISHYYKVIRADTTGGSDLSRVPREKGYSAIITRLDVLDGDFRPVDGINPKDSLYLRLHYSVSEPLTDPFFGVAIETTYGARLIGVDTRVQGLQMSPLSTTGSVICHFSEMPLLPGDYYITVGCGTRNTQLDRLPHVRKLRIDVRDTFGSGRILGAGNGLVAVDATWRQTEIPDARSN